MSDDDRDMVSDDEPGPSRGVGKGAKSKRDSSDDSDEPKNLRKKMHQLDEDLASQAENGLTVEQLTQMHKTSEHISSKVKKAADQVTASNTFSHLTQMSEDKVKNYVRSTATATPADLARKLVAKFATTTDDIPEHDVPITAFNHTRFGQFALVYFKSVRSANLQCMLGAVEAPKGKVKAAKVQRKKVVLGKELQPDQMDTSKQDDRNETSKLAEGMFEQVQAHHGKPYAHFVLNHNSFAQTVENMFSVAMLVGNAQVALRHSDEWGMTIHMVRGQYNGKTVPGLPKDGQLAQMVLNMNYQMWEALKGAVDPGDCLTPHRAAIRLAHDAARGNAPAGGAAGAAPKGGAKRAAKQGAGTGLTSSEDEGDDDAPGPSNKKPRKAAAA